MKTRYKDVIYDGNGGVLKRTNDIVIFHIPYPPTKAGKVAWNKRFGLNAYWSGKHYRQRAKDAQDIHSLTILALKKARIKKEPFTGPVKLTFLWADGMDIDNHAALGKMILDALKGWVVKDDSPRWVKEVTHKYWGGDYIRVIVEVYSESDRR